MDFNREDIIEILRGMCVVLPADTKLPLGALNQRLTRAISHAQAPIKSKEVNPDTLKMWREVSDVRLNNAMGALSVGEAEMIKMGPAAASGHWEMSVPEMLLNTFMMVRCIVGEMGDRAIEKSNSMIINNNAGTYSLTILVRCNFIYYLSFLTRVI